MPDTQRLKTLKQYLLRAYEERALKGTTGMDPAGIINDIMDETGKDPVWVHDNISNPIYQQARRNVAAQRGFSTDNNDESF